MFLQCDLFILMGVNVVLLVHVLHESTRPCCYSEAGSDNSEIKHSEV